MAIRITLGLWHASIERVEGSKESLVPAMRRALLDLVKNDSEFRRQIAKGQSTELERKIFGGSTQLRDSWNVYVGPPSMGPNEPLIQGDEV